MFYVHFVETGKRIVVEGESFEAIREQLATRGYAGPELAIYRVGDQACERFAYVNAGRVRAR